MQIGFEMIEQQRHRHEARHDDADREIGGPSPTPPAFRQFIFRFQERCLCLAPRVATRQTES